MNIWYYLSFAYFTLFGFFSFFVDKSKVPEVWSYAFFAGAIVAILILIKVDNDMRKDQEIGDYMASSERKQISQGIKDMEDFKKREATGKVTTGEYMRHIFFELQGIRMKMGRKKGLEERIADYFQKVENIPDFYMKEEWLETEKDIFDRLFAQAREDLASMGMRGGGGMDKYLGVLKKERERLLKAKERTF